MAKESTVAGTSEAKVVPPFIRQSGTSALRRRRNSMVLSLSDEGNPA
jgi:hypothetical protein